MHPPQFSICIPNFNYLSYLTLTCQSVTTQSYPNFEILISDNQSTDGSIDFIEDFRKSNDHVKVNINPVNLGFSANLEKVTSLASGKFFILLSSDDLMNAGCLQQYAKLIKACNNDRIVVGSSVFKIDSGGSVIERSLPDPEFWKESDIDQMLSEAMGVRVYKVPAKEMLQRCLAVMGNPYYFLTVCYPAELYHKVGGYSGGRMYNPDKWFNWKLFAQAEFVFLIDEPLFSYRWHTQNQVALETSFGHLKYLVDEYRNAIELTDDMLRVASMNRSSMEINFVSRNIYRHGIGEFSKGRWFKSMRIFFFGLATFPGTMITRKYFLLYVLLLLTTPIGSFIAARLINLFEPKK